MIGGPLFVFKIARSRANGAGTPRVDGTARGVTVVWMRSILWSRRHGELLLGCGPQGCFLGENFNPCHTRVRILRGGHALGNPAGNDLILG